ncbi:MAG: bifunctional UDP-3-O-[3-hydroxymyristoyl] N-acetylglucosamine deacetylase/3-hydroxyacyl-ACP dehydratase [Bacteroidales bacterium]|nr:bifunctional UDP-3-O-[3-hydroxymyristoyl] N-acetylglucosamine deacetylase/3-hydroxyacyl-ACP dehydratase [Bacteroidales bacterium]MDZ4204420.1 bifunctional UDP-3-O-[3-hydroxymyristoyl] N-acetylglucosamine deacetylase/3-hydroxyacyl-ACP dehydratase [Bacteroidales bacterium]
MKELQKTIKHPISLTGMGLHTGRSITLTFKPASENSGYKFQRIDLEGHPMIDATVENVVDTNRGTSLEQNGVRVNTTEHVLAACVGLGIDNVVIELDGPEVPIMDGSAKYFVEALEQTGLIEQKEEKIWYELNSHITYTNPDHNIELMAIPCDHFRLTVMIDFDTKVLGTQNAILNRIEDFKTEIAPCRTFVFLHELEYLIHNNLIKGGDLNNAIVFVNQMISQEELDRLAKFFNKQHIEVKKEGILNTLDLQFHNEPARHKMLDVIGDLALIGVPLKAHIIANKPGHSSNVQFAKLIRKHIRKVSKTPLAPIYDPNKPPHFDINDIKRILPHRSPFLLIDKILEITETGIIGVKNVTMNEPFFAGHFPDEPLMPGVLQVEALAQTGGVFVLNSVPDPENYITYFLKIENVRFRQKVVPGDTLVFKLELISALRRGVCHMRGTAWVGNKIVTEAELMAQIVRIPE